MSSPKPSKWLDILLLLFGVVLPLVTVAIEAVAGLSADAYFDPIPSLWHGLLITSVPLLNLLLLLAARWRRTEPRWRLGLGAGFSAGISLFYTLLFLPLLPLAVVAIMFGGLGLLPFAPLGGLTAAVVGYVRIARTDLETGHRGGGFWPGFVAALLVLFGLNATETLTRVGMQMATAPSTETRARGIRLLRAFGREDAMLRACYQRAWRPMDLLGMLYRFDDPITTDEARQVWYRVTGLPFNAVPAPRLGRGDRMAWADEIDFDEDQGGAAVAGRLKHLSLKSSRIDGSLDPDAALGYLEWTMVFENHGVTAAESRAQVALPPGGVVSRLTLWVNGEEREAAFAGRGQVREAYERVVRARRDPVLVTTSGPDRVLVQCFPVPPGGEMKIRLGITLPLELENREAALLRLPHFVERNFNVEGYTRHEVWLEADQPLSGSEALRRDRAGKGYALRGALSEAALSGIDATVRAARDPEVSEVWSDDPLGKEAAQVRQALVEGTVAAPSRVVMVIDGSRRMEPFLTEVAGALERFPAGLELAVVPASEDPFPLAGKLKRGPASLLALSLALREIDATGGQDNLPALVRAWELAASEPGSVILWVHGPQPVELEPADSLVQRWERRPDGPRMLTLAAEAGPNRVLEQLGELAAVRPLARAGSLEADLERLFSSWSGAEKRLVPIRERLVGAPAAGETVRTSSHLVRLWAKDEVDRRLELKQPKARDEALQLAARYQLVTPVSGAVVLETQAQYDEAGLNPVPPGTVPTVPEPHEWALILIAALSLVWTWRRRGLSWTL